MKRFFAASLVGLMALAPQARADWDQDFQRQLDQDAMTGAAEMMEMENIQRGVDMRFQALQAAQDRREALKMQREMLELQRERFWREQSRKDRAIR